MSSRGRRRAQHIGLSGNAALNVLALYDFARHDRMDGLKKGPDEALVTGAAGLICLNPNHKKLFPPPPAEESIRRLQRGLKDEPCLYKMRKRIKVKTHLAKEANHGR